MKLNKLYLFSFLSISVLALLLIGVGYKSIIGITHAERNNTLLTRIHIGINWNGYFQIQNTNGSILYTRDGTFYLNDQHQLVTIDGLLLVPNVTFPENLTSVPQITSDGIITYNGEQIGSQMQIAKFINPFGLIPSNVGSWYYTESQETWSPIVGNPWSNNYWTIVENTWSSAIMSVVHAWIHGNGYFQVQNYDGTTLYTRNNIFHLDNQGRLVTLEGYLLTPTITLREPIDSNNTQIDIDGIVTSFNQVIWTIQLARFINPTDLLFVGSWYYATSEKSGQPSVSNPHTNGMWLLVSELSYQNTGFHFAMGISGNGYFQVQDPDGTILYTRNNIFYLNNQNQLSTKEWLLLSPTITFPENLTHTPQISNDWVVSYNDQTLGNIQLAVFTNPAGLVSSDLGLWYYKLTYKSWQPMVGNPGSNVYGSLALGSTSTPLILGIDVAINGNGYFQVQNYDGTTLYTRNGTFFLDANGRLVTSNEDVVEPNITFPIGSINSTNITSDGDVFIWDNNNIGSIQLANFPNSAALSGSSISSNYYMANQTSGDPTVGRPSEWGNGTLSFRLRTTSSASPTVNLDSTPSCSKMTLTITWDGYFQIQNNDWSIMYTRNTIFQLDNQGRLVTPEWYLLLPNITLPNAIDNNTLITNRGVVTEKIQWTQYGTIQLARFNDPTVLNDVGQWYYTESAESWTPIIGNPWDQGFGILQYNNICSITTTTSLLPNSNVSSDIINALIDNGYKLVGNNLVGNWDISLEATNWIIPITLNIVNNNIKVILPWGIRLMQANHNFLGTISPPTMTNISSINWERVLSAFKIGGDLQSIIMTWGVVTIYVPVSDVDAWDLVNIYYSHNNWIDWQSDTITNVIMYNGQHYVEFTTNHFTDFTITLPSGLWSWSFVINNDAASTTSAGVTLNISTTPPVNQMRFSNDNSTRSNWEPYGTTTGWTLPWTYWPKTIYAQFDIDGDWTGDITTNDSINYTAPWAWSSHGSSTWNLRLQIITSSWSCSYGTSLYIGSHTSQFVAYDMTGSNFSSSFSCVDTEGLSGWTMTMEATTDLSDGAQTISKDNVSLIASPNYVSAGACTTGTNQDSWVSIGSTPGTILWKSSGQWDICTITSDTVNLAVHIPASQAVGLYTGTLSLNMPF